MKMSMGMNTNVKHDGRIYHIQTEDGGEKRPIITTLLFKDGGVVLSSKRTDYTDLLQSDSCRETVMDRMKEQHKAMIRMLMRGEIKDEHISEQEGPPPEDLSQKMEKKDTPVFVENTPLIDADEISSKILSGEDKDLDTLILEYLAKKESDVA